MAPAIFICHIDLTASHLPMHPVLMNSHMTEDAMLCSPSASSFILLSFPPYIFSSYIHMPPPFFPPPSLALPSLLLSPSTYFCQFFSSPSHLRPSLKRVWHAHGPNSIIDQIKEILLNSLNRQKEHTHTPDMLKGCSHTHTGKQIFTLCSLGSLQKKSLTRKWTNCNFRLCP